MNAYIYITFNMLTCNCFDNHVEWNIVSDVLTVLSVIEDSYVIG